MLVGRSQSTHLTAVGVNFKSSRVILIFLYHCFSILLNMNEILKMFLLFRAIMHDVSNDNRVLSLVAQSGIRNTLVTLLDQLQRCQKSLNEFLEVRIVFL